MTNRFRPDLYSHVARHVIAPLWALKERTPYLLHMQAVRGSSRRPLEEVCQEQMLCFRSLLVHAYETTSFYRRRLDQAGVDPHGLSSMDDLKRIPLLTKDDIRRNTDRMLSDQADRHRLVPIKTSGSTGVSLKLFMDETSRQWKRACTTRYDMWAGWHLGERVGAIWGNPESEQNWRMWLRNLLLVRHVCLDTLKMDEDAMSRYHRRLLAKRPTILFGHAHSLYLFALFLKSEGVRDIRPRGVISTAMVLHDFERALMEDIFGCKVTNRYGCEEVSLMACECEAHSGLHVNMDSLVFECVDSDGNPVSPGEPGAVVVTDLTNFAMPIIRYKVGDVARMSVKPCSCGRSYPLVESIEGRIADYIRTPEGQFVSGISLTENFAMALEGVKQLQIVQKAFDRLIFRIVRGREWTPDQALRIAELVRERFGRKMRHEIDFVDSIQSEQSGKYRFCISLLEQPVF